MGRKNKSNKKKQQNKQQKTEKVRLVSFFKSKVESEDNEEEIIEEEIKPLYSKVGGIIITISESEDEDGKKVGSIKREK